MKYKKKVKKRVQKKIILSLNWQNEDKKHGLFVFSNSCSILELMLCNWNLEKLVYPSLLSSICRAWAWKLSEYLKERKKIHQIRAKKAIY